MWFPLPSSRPRAALLGAALFAVGAAPRAGAQAPMVAPLPAANASMLPVPRTATPKPVAGDGRVKAPADIEVGYAPLKPMQVSTVILHPGMATVLRFPYVVKGYTTPDDGTFLFRTDANLIEITPKDCLQGCVTNLFVKLDDGDYTLVPFLLAVDTTKTVTMLVDYSDPVSARIRAKETQLAQQYEARAQSAVAEQLEPEVERCIANGFAFRPVNRANAWKDPRTGESIGVTVADVGFSGRCLAMPKLYVRYTIHNARYAPTASIKWTLRRENRARHLSTSVPVAEDRRDPVDVPPLRQVRGELVLDGTLVLAPGDVLTLTAEIDGHTIEVGPILSAPPTPKER